MFSWFWFVIVSIPRSEFCLFGHEFCHLILPVVSDVSIPRSEFCLFGLGLCH